MQLSRAIRAQPRRVNKIQLDAEDQIIVQMKEAGHSDEIIRDKLIDLGMTVYVARSIATRYGSIKKVMAEREDQMLDDELTDWHEGEVSSRLAVSILLVLTKMTQDDLLNEAEQEATAELRRKYHQLEYEKWNLVKCKLAIKMDRVKYTGRACKERFEGLQNDTAPPPFEADPDPARRKLLAIAAVAERKRKREEAEAQAQHEEDRAAAASAAKRRNSTRDRRKSVRRASTNQRARANPNTSTVDATTRRTLDEERTKFEEKKKREEARATQRQATDRLAMARKVARLDNERAVARMQETREAERRRLANILRARMGVAALTTSTRLDNDQDDVTTSDQSTPNVSDADLSSPADLSTNSSLVHHHTPRQHDPAPTFTSTPSVSTILSDPRYRLTATQLKVVLAGYAPRAPRGGTKMALVTRIQMAVAGMGKAQLLALVRRRGIAEDGSKRVILERIAAWDVKEAGWGRG